MGFLKKLLGIGVTAGATVAAVRVSDKYKANNPNGVGDVNGDGKVDAKDVAQEIKRAAKEVYADTVKDTNGDGRVDAQDVADNVSSAVKTAATTLSNAAKTAAEGVKDALGGNRA